MVRRRSAKKVGRSGQARAASKDPSKKYWWLLLVALPIILALIQLFPHVVKLFKPSDEVKPLVETITIGSMSYITTINVLEKEYEKARGEPLKDQELKEKFERASELAKQGNYKEAIVLLEEIAPKADVAAIANNLGVLRAQSGDLSGAQKDFERATAKDPKDPVAKVNAQALDKLPGNLLAKENGGQVILAPNDDWLKTIDGKEEGSGLVFRTGNSAVYAFKDERPATFDTFAVLVPSSGHNVKEFELLAGNESATGEFHSLGKFTVVNAKFMKSPYQEFKFPPATAKYLKVFLVSSYSVFPYVGEIELFEFRLLGQLQK